MRFASVSHALIWYAVAREGAPRATRLEPITSTSRRPSSSPGPTLTTIADIGCSLRRLPELEQRALVLRHVEGLAVEQIARRLSDTYRRRFIRRTVEGLIREGEGALAEELERRNLLGDVPPED